MESSALSQIVILKHISGNKILKIVPTGMIQLSLEVAKHFPEIEEYSLTYYSPDKIEK